MGAEAQDSRGPPAKRASSRLLSAFGLARAAVAAARCLARLARVVSLSFRPPHPPCRGGGGGGPPAGGGEAGRGAGGREGRARAPPPAPRKALRVGLPARGVLRRP